ncbi:superoxide dismutase [Mn] [soil metagenome]
MKNSTDRRTFIRNAGLATLGTIALSSAGSKIFGAASPIEIPSFKLPPLPYAYDALEPHIDALTMQIHHDKHHQGYVDNLNKAVIENKILEPSLEKILGKVSKYPAALRNNAGGHYNHSLFWTTLKPNGGGYPPASLKNAIVNYFRSFDEFQGKFNDAAKGRFGSGWAWLIKSSDGGLYIGSTPNQDNPLMDDAEFTGTPLLALDVWEHAYYLHYQNKRADYIAAFWNLIDWEEVSRRYEAK